MRELMVGANRFNEIQRGLPGLSRSMLSGRLRQLKQQGLIEHTAADPPGYQMTAAGAATRDIIMALGRWTVAWRFPLPQTTTSDSALMLWRIYQGVKSSALPDRKVTIQLTFNDGDPRYGWIVLDRPDVSLCFEPSKSDADLRIAATVATWQSIWFGHRDLTDAMRSGDLTAAGSRDVIDQFPNWFALSDFAADVAARAS